MNDEPTHIVRASSWSGLFNCAYSFEGTYLLGMRKPSGIRAALGTALHASTAAFDTARMLGTGISSTEAAGVLVDRLRDPGYEVDHRQDTLNVQQAERIGLSLHSQYTLDWSPRYQFRAVEMETKPLDIDCGGGVTIRLTGTLDRSRLVETPGGGARIADLKSGSRAVSNGVANTKGHAAQVGTYEILYAHSTGEAITAPAEIIGMQTSGTPRIASGEIVGARELMVGTPGGPPGLIEVAAKMFRSGSFAPNPNSVTCDPRWCSRWNSCVYHR